MNKIDSIKQTVTHNCLKVLKVKLKIGKSPYNFEMIFFDRITSIK